MIGSRHRFALSAAMTLLGVACEDASPTPFPPDSGADADAAPDATEGAPTCDAQTPEEMSKDSSGSDDVASDTMVPRDGMSPS